jgi:hypothetical protein
VFPSDESAKKVIYLAIEQASKKWTMPIQNWRMALNRFVIEFGDRLNGYQSFQRHLHRKIYRLSPCRGLSLFQKTSLQHKIACIHTAIYFMISAGYQANALHFGALFQHSGRAFYFQIFNQNYCIVIKQYGAVSVFNDGVVAVITERPAWGGWSVCVLCY